MKKTLFKITALILTMVFCIGSFVGCGKKEEDTIKLAIMKTGFTLPLHYAVENGYFEDAGLNVEVSYFDNGPQINEAIASGDADIAGIGQMPSITGGITNSSKIVAWMEDDEQSIQGFVRADSDIATKGKGHIEDHPEIYGTAEEWVGKKIICAKGTSSHYGLLATLNALGLKESDIELINMEGAKGATAFASGEGDVFFGFDPQWATFYTESDKYVQVSTCKNAGESLCCVLMASDAFCKNDSDSVVKFIEVLLSVEQELKQDENKYYNEMYNWQSYYGNCTEELAKYSAQIKPLRSVEEQQEMFAETDGTSEISASYDTVLDFMITNGVIQEADKQTFYDNNSIDAQYLFKAIENISK